MNAIERAWGTTGMERTAMMDTTNNVLKRLMGRRKKRVGRTMAWFADFRGPLAIKGHVPDLSVSQHKIPRGKMRMMPSIMFEPCVLSLVILQAPRLRARVHLFFSPMFQSLVASQVSLPIFTTILLST
jgi:hypothetical protein